MMMLLLITPTKRQVVCFRDMPAQRHASPWDKAQKGVSRSRILECNHLAAIERYKDKGKWRLPPLLFIINPLIHSTPLHSTLLHFPTTLSSSSASPLHTFKMQFKTIFATLAAFAAVASALPTSSSEQNGNGQCAVGQAQCCSQVVSNRLFRQYINR